LYLDTCYIAKFYFNEVEFPQVRELVRTADTVISSVWALAEFHGVIHRRLREGSATPNDAQELSDRFSDHIQQGLWKLVPVTESLLRRSSVLIMSAPVDIFIRTADAVHLATAHDAGEREVWTNDRHMLAAAAHFGLIGRSI
jgi:predicted nucleic acid-binding protein